MDVGYYKAKRVTLCSKLLACVFIVKAIIINFSEDRDVGICYLFTKFELDRSTNNGDLLSERNYWKHRQTDKQTDTHTYIHTQTESDIGYRVE